jgi:tRNA splicing endonuclease
MGNIIKINMYVEAKKRNKLNLQTVEEAILKYNSWLKITNREDKIENYEKFLQAQ